MHKLSIFSPCVAPLSESGYRRRWLLSTLLLLTLLTLVGCRSGSADLQFISRGKDLIVKKQYARALIEFKNASRLRPNNAEPYYQSGLAYLATGDYQSGYQSLLKATELDPKHMKAQEKLAEVIASSVSNTRIPEQLQEAEKRVQSVLAVVPDSPQALSALGIAEYSLGKPEEGIKHLEAALEKSPQYLKAATSLAVIKIRNKDLRGAENILRKVAADSPQAPDAQLALGRFFETTGRASEAEAAYREALTIDAKFGPALLDLARVEFVAGRKDDAEKTLAILSALPDKQYRAYHANFLLAEGKVDEAVKEFEQQAAADPKDREAFSRLTSAYFITRKFPEAEAAINAALKRNPKDTNALLDRSRVDLMTAEFTEAENDLNQILGADPNSAMARYLLSTVFVARGRRLAARQELGKALEFDPNLLAARLELAQSLTADGAAKSALDVLEQAPEEQKNLLPVLVARNYALIGIKDRVELRKSLVRGLAMYKQAPDLVFQDGLLKFQASDIAGARTAFEQVLAVRPVDAVALDSLAQTYAYEKRPDQALKTVELYASKHPNSAPLQNVLGNWFATSKRRDDARKAYRAALASDPTLFQAHMSLIIQDTAEGKYDSARQELTALARIPVLPANRAVVEATLGMIESKTGNSALAILHYRKALDADPNNLIALNNLAYRLADSTDQIDEALKYAQQAKELDPNNIAVEDTIGWAFYRKGLYDNAVVHLQNAAAKQGTAVFKYHLAMAYMKTGDLRRGQQTLEEARRMDPNLPEAASASRLMASLSRAN